MKYSSLVAVIVMSTALLVGYNSCMSSYSSVNSTGSSYAGSALIQCENFIAPTFVDGYYPFFRANCISCHTGSGPGRGSFAHPDPTLAMREFLLRGPNLVSQKGTDGHGGSYTSG